MSGIYIVQLSLLILSYQLCVSSKTLNYYDICKNNGHKIYLELEENGILEATNLTQNGSIKQECYLEIVTCPSCVIFVNFSYINLSNKCNETKINNINCACEYIQIFEHPYEELSIERLCGEDVNHFRMKTLTRNIVVQLFYLFNNELAFTAEYKSIRNQMFLTENKLIKSNKYLLSPFFPSYYSNDLTSEYIISCPEIQAENCQIRLIFTDFQLATESLMEFFDWNGQRLDVVTGLHFRPPILLSTGPSLVVKFYANGGTGLGYKAEYSFEQNDKNASEFITDCGGYVDNLGGGITMMNMVEKGLKKFDCFWIIKPPKSYLHFKTYLYLKIANFSKMEDETEIIVHQSSTSAGKILEVLRHPNQEMYPINPREHIQPIETGFYVSFNGSFGAKSRLAIIYAAFSYKECFSAADFLCENHRCIPRQLTCDGFDHCGDGSDEPVTCYKDANPEPIDRRWYSRTPNYFFPKIDPYYDLKTATLIFIMSVLGTNESINKWVHQPSLNCSYLKTRCKISSLISLVSTLFVLLYRINSRARHERELQNHLQIITELLEEEILDTDSITDEPPVYEAPPDYDEIIKINFDAPATEVCKLTKPKRKKKRNKPVKSQRLNRNDTQRLELLVNQNITSNCDLSTVINENVTSKLPIKNEDGKHKWHFRKNNPFLYFSNKTISSNVKFIIKRKWHSHGELNIKKTLENKNEKSTLMLTEKSYKCFSREIASDSELLNMTMYDEDDYKNSVYSSYASERITQDEKGLFDYFKKKTSCQCEGACGCATIQNVSKKYTRKFNRKIAKKKQSKFYTR